MPRSDAGGPGSLMLLARGVALAWDQTHASFMAAALAFYSLISIAPLMILLLFAAGSVFGPEEVQRNVLRGLEPIVGAQGAELLRGLSASAYSQGQRWVASLIGLSVIAYGSARVFLELQRALHVIFHDPQQPRQVWTGPLWLRIARAALFWIRTQLLSFVMVLGVGVLWFVGIVSSTAISAVGAWVGDHVPETLRFASLIHLVASTVLLTLTVGLVYRYLPLRRPRWHQVWPGALLTAVMLTGGQKVIGTYLGYKTITSVYGAAGSVVLVIFWFYYSWLVFFLGAVFTRVYALRARARHKAGSEARRAEKRARISGS